ncbi:MAG: hypothetical protein LRY27_03075 [Chitinophagales bacterium]|nr:hypothetical protein [Chitinophagales bacterium]
MYSGAWVKDPASLDDFYQLWHTESYNGGSNYIGFGTAYTDELIEKIRFETDETKRNKMYIEFQEILHNEAPYIFLSIPLNKMAIHKRFENSNAYVGRPPYNENEFKLKC